MARVKETTEQKIERQVSVILTALERLGKIKATGREFDKGALSTFLRLRVDEAIERLGAAPSAAAGRFTLSSL